MRPADLNVPGDTPDAKITELISRLRPAFKEVYDKFADLEVKMNTFDATTHTPNRAAAAVREMEHEMTTESPTKLNRTIPARSSSFTATRSTAV